MPFDFTSGNPDNLVGGGPARMIDIQGPFYDLRTWLNSATGGGGGASSASGVLAAAQILDVGLLNQRRAGRQLTNADFTSLGLSVPIALWNLGDLTDVSGNGRVLSNKGSVSFAAGINGVATTAAQFTGTTGQALYIVDAGANDPFRIRTGSWGCWFRTAKRGTAQRLIAKESAADGNWAWDLVITATNGASAQYTPNGLIGSAVAVNGVSDVADDRWHFAVATHDATAMRIYVDGVLEGVLSVTALIANGGGPLNIGGYGADAGTAAAVPHFGRIDEAFVTSDILTEDQIRCLYATKLTHTLGAVPTAVRLNVHRRRRGSALVVSDFTTAPLRLHNFTAGSLGDEGTSGLTLTNNGTAVAVAGADGTSGNGFSFAGAQSLSQTDAGLPAGTTARSYGCWFKSTFTSGGINFFAWGTVATGDARLLIGAGGALNCNSAADSITGPFVTDGQWHQVIAVEDNAAGDLVKRKLYLDGRLVGGSTVLNAITLAGANSFRVGAGSAGAGPFTGQIDRAFVTGYAMTTDDVTRMYAKGSQDLGSSPKNAGDHVERVDSSSVLFIGDTLESQHTVDLGVVA
jgi:hypothetical protein